MTTRREALLSWADRWRTLRAWRRDLAEVKIEVSDRQYVARLGTCWPDEQRIVIYLGPSFLDELGTLLHELAHAAVFEHGHSVRWQTTFANAVNEVTGIAVVPVAYNYRVLNSAAKDAFEAWWLARGRSKMSPIRSAS